MENLWNSILAPAVIAVVVSGVFGLVSKWLDRKWNRGDRLSAIEKKVNKNEADSVRLQMLVLMADYPNEVSEIMKVAEHYFSDIKGNWYMTSIFNRWLEANEIAEPEWFKGDK